MCGAGQHFNGPLCALPGLGLGQCWPHANPGPCSAEGMEVPPTVPGPWGYGGGGGWQCSYCLLDPAVPGGWQLSASGPQQRWGDSCIPRCPWSTNGALVPLPSDWSLCPPCCTPALVLHQALPHGHGQPGCWVPAPAATLCSPLQYGGREWNCWDRLEMQAVGTDGQEATVQEVLDWLQVSPVQTAPNQVTLVGCRARS